MKRGKLEAIGLVAFIGALLIAYQNCSNTAKFEEAKLGSLGVCDGISCDLDPLTFRPAVTTILLALGDEANDQLVVNGASSQLIAETVVRYSSPKKDPKILLVRDSKAGSEDPEDTEYMKSLLSRYDVTYLVEPREGLTDKDLEGFDLVWFNNPGAPMGLAKTRDALLKFSGGVVMQGDDLSRGGDFALGELTGLKYVDNGTSVRCGERDYPHNDNNGDQYRVSIDASKIIGGDADAIEFKYGNDIDLTTSLRSDLEILATAKGGPDVCVEERPTIVRYLK